MQLEGNEAFAEAVKAALVEASPVAGTSLGELWKGVGPPRRHTRAAVALQARVEQLQWQALWLEDAFSRWQGAVSAQLARKSSAATTLQAAARGWATRKLPRALVGEGSEFAGRRSGAVRAIEDGSSDDALLDEAIEQNVRSQFGLRLQPRIETAAATKIQACARGVLVRAATAYAKHLLDLPLDRSKQLCRRTLERIADRYDRRGLFGFARLVRSVAIDCTGDGGGRSKRNRRRESKMKEKGLCSLTGKERPGPAVGVGPERRKETEMKGLCAPTCKE